MLASTMAAAVQVRGRAWQSAPTAHKPSADARIMLAPNPYLLYIFHHKRLFTSVCARLPPTPTTPLLTPVYQLASLAALDTLASARLRRTLPLSLSFYFSFSLSLSLTSECARLRRACPPSLFSLTPLLCQLASLAALETRASARLRRVSPFSLTTLSLSFSLSLSLSLPLSFLIS